MDQSDQLSVTRIIIIGVAFQAGWLACVVGAAYGYPWLGVMAVPGVAAVEIILGRLWARSILLPAGVIALAGVAIDSVLTVAGIFNFPDSTSPADWTLGWTQWVAPPFIVALWTIFALSLKPLYRWMKGRLALQIAFGAIGGSSSYFAGVKLGALELAPSNPVGLTIVAVVWGLFFPTAMFFIHAHNEERPTEEEPN